VASDNLEAGYRGTRHLIELGHRDITLMISSSDHRHLSDRVEGYRRALAEAGLGGHERVVFGGGAVETCRSAIEQDLRRPDRPTAVFAATFYGTVGAVKAISALGMDFPGEISLLGFEHSEWMTALRPYISSISQSVETLASHSWQTLQERISGERTSLAREMIPFRLNVRESTRPPKGFALPQRVGGLSVSA
jgi:LacI family transcriptional regulator